MDDGFNQGELNIEFAENPEPRCPCVLLLDTSESMGESGRIEALTDGLKAFKQDLQKDALACRRVEVAIVTFSDTVTLVQDFVTVDNFEPPDLTARGRTCMGQGITTSLDMIAGRKSLYKANGVSYYRPWLFMITDGEPQGEDLQHLVDASRRVRDAEADKQILFYSVAVAGANMELLRLISDRAPVRLHGSRFVDMFIWLSRSAVAVSRSATSDQVALPPAGWGRV